ncbi:MAG: (2Fe-2S)-binding protein [Pseudomonadales bacterium]
MPTTSITINGKSHDVQSLDPEMPLLWYLRDELGLVGTKFGCGIGSCGACTVHINGLPMRSCRTPLSMLAGQEITTIEGLSGSDVLGPLQKAWVALDVPQCGYCQSGQLMAASALLVNNPQPTDDDIDAAMSGNLCRCGTYPRIRAAISMVANETLNPPTGVQIYDLETRNNLGEQT